jgi:hypothetical protein
MDGSGDAFYNFADRREAYHDGYFRQLRFSSQSYPMVVGSGLSLAARS